MSLNHKYDRDNIFAKIITGDIPSAKIYEDDTILSFMDVFPQSRGHALVISKRARAVNLFDIEQKELHQVINGVQKIGQAIKAGLKPEGIRVAQFNGSAAGQTVYHLHFHLIPVYDGESLGEHGGGKQANSAELDAVAAQIAKHIPDNH